MFAWVSVRIAVKPTVHARYLVMLCLVDRSPHHVVLQVGERDLGLDHPELRQVPAGVAVLRPERGAEGVHAGQGARVVLHLHAIQLACRRKFEMEPRAVVQLLPMVAEARMVPCAVGTVCHELRAPFRCECSSLANKQVPMRYSGEQECRCTSCPCLSPELSRHRGA